MWSCSRIRFEIAAAATGIANSEVIDPATQCRVDNLHYPICGLREKRRKLSLSLRSSAVRCLSLGG
jgi:hypothetical protein